MTPHAKALTLLGASDFLGDGRQWFAPRAAEHPSQAQLDAERALCAEFPDGMSWADERGRSPRGPCAQLATTSFRGNVRMTRSSACRLFRPDRTQQGRAREVGPDRGIGIRKSAPRR